MIDPTGWADWVAEEMRDYLDANPESRKERRMRTRYGTADNQMLRLINIVERRSEERRRLNERYAHARGFVEP